MTAGRLVLLRHGRTASNAAGVWQGQLDVPLDEVGVAQAARSAVALARLSPVRVVSSDLSRAVATATPLAAAAGLEPETDPTFREVHAGEWQGLGSAEIDARWPVERAAWGSGADLRFPGGESRSEAADRVVAGLRREVEATPSGVLVVVGHGGSLRSGALRLLDAPEDGSRWLGRMLNAHWAVLVRRDDRWVLESWNASAPDQPDDVAAAAVD